MRNAWAIRSRMFGAFIVLCLFLGYGGIVCAQDQSSAEARLTNFIKKMYDRDEYIEVRLGHMPTDLRGRPNITNISFVRVPDGRGEGLCLVELGGMNRRVKNVYVPFRVVRKTKVFVLTDNARRGDTITENLVAARDTILHGHNSVYPVRVDDILGKVLKRNAVAGTVITASLLDDPILIQKGEMVTIIVENRRLLVQAKGKALEKGRMGETIRVKNVSSEKEIFAKVVGENTVNVSF